MITLLKPWTSPDNYEYPAGTIFIPNMSTQLVQGKLYMYSSPGGAQGQVILDVEPGK
jgi:hypothetical protein